MALQPIYKPPFYQPKLPIGGGGGAINLSGKPSLFGESGLTDIAKIITGGIEQKRQRELAERKLSMEEEYKRAQIGALDRRGQRTTSDVIKEMTNLPVLENPELYPAEAQAIEQRKQVLLQEYAELTNQTIENVPGTPGHPDIPASDQWNPYKKKTVELPAVPAVSATEGYRKLVPRSESPSTPKPVPPGLESIIGDTFKEEKPQKPTKKAEAKPTKEKQVSEEPASEQDFISKVAELKATDMKAARSYYDKWVKKWQ